MPQAPDQALLNRLVIEWYNVAQGNAPTDGLSPFFKFVAAWIAFNAMYSQDARPDDTEDRQIRRFCQDPPLQNCHDSLLDSDDEYRAATTYVMERPIQRLSNRPRRSDRATMEGIFDGPPPQRRRPSDITRLSGDAEAVMIAIYRIRNNLFHGGKRPYNPRDRRLVEASCRIITSLLSDRIRNLSPLV
jgi:hypothetical protein